jgi:hypothetical protein
MGVGSAWRLAEILWEEVPPWKHTTCGLISGSRIGSPIMSPVGNCLVSSDGQTADLIAVLID